MELEPNIKKRLNAIQSKSEPIFRKYHVERVAFFGSVLTNGFDEFSDVDFLVDYKDFDTGIWGSNQRKLVDELQETLKRKVDLVAKSYIDNNSHRELSKNINKNKVEFNEY